MLPLTEPFDTGPVKPLSVEQSREQKLQLSLSSRICSETGYHAGLRTHHSGFKSPQIHHLFDINQ